MVSASVAVLLIAFACAPMGIRARGGIVNRFRLAMDEVSESCLLSHFSVSKSRGEVSSGGAGKCEKMLEELLEKKIN